MELSNPESLSNFIKMQILLSRANSLLRNIFLRRWTECKSLEWDSSSAGLYITGIGKEMYKKVRKFHIQRTHIESGDLNQWDLTMLTDALILTDFSGSSMTIEEKTIEKSKLDELKIVRNKIAHSPSPLLEDEIFKSLWEKGSEVLISFGCSEEELNKIKTSVNLGDFQDENSSGHLNNVNSGEAMRLKDEGNRLHRIGEFERAVDLYSEAIALRGLLYSELAILYSNRSVAYLSIAKQNDRHSHSEEIHCALQDGKEALRLNPTWFRGYFRTGNAYYELQKFQRALEYFDSAISLCPARDELRKARDNCRIKIGQNERQENLDPGGLPKTEEDKIKKIQIKLGPSATQKSINDELALIYEKTPGGKFVKEALRYMSGEEIVRDPEMAAKLYTKAAALGNAEAMYNLGLLYKDGVGVQQDFSIFIKLMRQAASQPHDLPEISYCNFGVAEAEHAIGLAHEEGICVMQDLRCAAKWYERSSEHGYTRGSNRLAGMYISGRGVPIDHEIAEYYWRLSASQGDQSAMLKLAKYYLKVEVDSGAAREWYDQAIKNGNLEAQLNKIEFEKKLKKIEKETEDAESDVINWENETGLSSKGMTFASRIKRMTRATVPTATNMLDSLEEIFKRAVNEGTTPTTDDLYDFDPNVIQNLARNGSETAKNIFTALGHYTVFWELLTQSDYRRNSDEIIHELSECYRFEQLVVRVTRPMKERLFELVSAALNLNYVSENDMDARVCYVHLQMDTLEHMLIFMEHSIRRYPNEKALHLYYSNLFGFLRKHELGVKETEKSLEISPQDVDLLQCRATHYRLLKTEDRDSAIKAYEDFLAVAPIDHRKVPEAYYAISNEYMTKWSMCKNKRARNANRRPTPTEKNCLIKMEEFFVRGVDSEKVQLPCFLPNSSNQRSYAHMMKNNRSK